MGWGSAGAVASFWGGCCLWFVVCGAGVEGGVVWGGRSLVGWDSGRGEFSRSSFCLRWESRRRWWSRSRQRLVISWYQSVPEIWVSGMFCGDGWLSLLFWLSLSLLGSE